MVRRWWIMTTRPGKWPQVFRNMCFSFTVFSHICSSGPQQAFRGVSGRSVRGQGVHRQDGSGQPEVGPDCGCPLLSHQETVWTQRRRGVACAGVPDSGQSAARVCQGNLQRHSSLLLLQQWRLIPYLAAAYALEHFTKSFFLNFVEFQMGQLMKDKSNRQVGSRSCE